MGNPISSFIKRKKRRRRMKKMRDLMWKKGIELHNTAVHSRFYQAPENSEPVTLAYAKKQKRKKE